MILRPQREDYKVIGFYTGKIIIGLGLLMLVPLVTALIYAEPKAALDFVYGFAVAIGLGYLSTIICRTDREMTWGHGMVMASFSWLVAMVVAALPSFLSGHYGSYLDACFDVMSGFTTTGFFLIQDLDHVSIGLNMWRHLLTFAGGQGIIVIALTFLIKATSGAVRIYVGEGKDERLLPNVVETARAIWFISLVYLIVGSLVLFFCLLFTGVGWRLAAMQGPWLFMSAWSTGGFAPYSQNMLYWHSLPLELITLIIFVIGSFNFALHYAVWTKSRREIVRNIETVSFFATVTITFSLVLAGLMQKGIYPNIMAMVRKGFYQLISGHTTTGLQTIYVEQFGAWGDLALGAMVIAMLIGASACSTAGGFKGIRVGILIKGLIQDVKRYLLPPDARSAMTFHHVRQVVLEDSQVRSAALIVLSYIAMFVFGTILAMAYGYDFWHAAFETASTTGNVGLSAGLVNPAMPWVLKVNFILTMWAGRLEFISCYVMLAFIITAFKGVKGKR